MIIIKIKGGLGNQLFQYAYGRLLSITRNEELLLDTDALGSGRDTYRAYSLDQFHIQARQATPEEVRTHAYPLGVFSKVWRFLTAKVFRRQYIGWMPRMLSTRAGYLDGYWQSYQYPDRIRDVLLSDLVLRDPIDIRYADMIDQMQKTDSVSVHVRRGDYVDNPDTKKYHFICDDSYYERAVSYIRRVVPKPTLFVFSDDIAWVKAHMTFDTPVIFVSRPEIKVHEELVLMSRCHHHIIANSTFSWWGAWLNQRQGKIVIAPREWNRRYPNQFYHIVPPEWIRV